MKLIEYLIKEGMSRHEFSQYAGVSDVTIYKVCNGHIPSKKTAHKIIFATKGKVSTDDLRPNNQEKKNAKKGKRTEEGVEGNERILERGTALREQNWSVGNKPPAS